jgi:RNA-directed DNA polymerase
LHDRYRHSVALGLAQAMLAGPPHRAGLAARLRAVTGERGSWIDALAQAIANACVLSWPLQRTETLAARVLHEPAFLSAFSRADVPRLVRYFLRPGKQVPPPLGLDEVDLPALATVGDLAAWLGIDNDTLDWFANAPARRRHAALPQQHYQWRWWPKREGVRVLEVPRARLRARLKVLQRRLHADLLARVPPHEAACGFTPGRGILDHARPHVGQAVLMRFDLRDFFGSVRASRVHALFATLGYSPAVSRTLAALTTSRVPEPYVMRWRDEGLIDHAHAARLRSAHLPQGAPTSPALANLCTFTLDLRLAALARSCGARYSRYADDLVISGGRGLAARRMQLEALVGAAAREEGFALQHRKTHCATRAGAQRVCGIVVNDKPNLPRAEFDRLKAVLHRCVVDGPSMQNRSGIADWRGHLVGRVSWALQVNPEKAARLSALLSRIDWTR